VLEQSPAGAAPGRADRRARRNGRRMLLAGVGSIAAAAVALAAIAVTGSGSGGPSDGDSSEAEATDPDADGSPTTGGPDISLAAQITAASREASQTSLIHTLRDNQYVPDGGAPAGDEESWTDEQSGARRDLYYDSNGEPSFDTGRVTAPAVDDPGPPPLPPDAQPFDPSLPQERLRQVDYCFSEYTEYDQTAIPGHVEADRIGEWWLAEGTLVEDGTETVDGRDLIRLVQVPADLLRPEPRPDGSMAVDLSEAPVPGAATTEPPPTTSTTTEVDPSRLDPDTFEYTEHIYLVDAETFRPVRVIGYPGEAADYSDASYIATIEYLPRTPENLAKLVAPVPAGFQLVPDLRGDGERADACGW
jgi:hypothetical protein